MAWRRHLNLRSLPAAKGEGGCAAHCRLRWQLPHPGLWQHQQEEQQGGRQQPQRLRRRPPPPPGPAACGGLDGRLPRSPCRVISELRHTSYKANDRQRELHSSIQAAVLTVGHPLPCSIWY